jgi:mono/diheme cytochrome c family protein
MMGLAYSSVIVFTCAISLSLGEWRVLPEKSASPQPLLQLAASGICPHTRNTRSAPSRQQKKTNPLPPSAENLMAGEKLYRKDAKPTACYLCHGRRGNGNGSLAPKLNPPPRNFTCAETMNEISDGQLFWIIKNGSRGTTMPAHEATLRDKEIWQLVHFIRQFSR